MLDSDGCTCRPENGAVEDFYLRVPEALRDHLQLFKGCRLSVLLAMALRSDTRGLVSVDTEKLSAETGYNKATVAYTIADLCRLTVNNHRVLVLCEQSTLDSAAGDISYLLFPGNGETF